MNGNEHRNAMSFAASFICIALCLFLTACGSRKQPDIIDTAKVDTVEADTVEAANVSEAGNVVISEMMPKNTAFCTDKDGDISDWIELENISSHDVCLRGWSLSDTKHSWMLTELTIPAGGRTLIYASGKDCKDGELHTDFSISEGERIYLTDPHGDVSDVFEAAECGADRSLVKDSDKPCSYPTPGFENSAEGYEEYMQSCAVPETLIINEVMPSNDSTAYHTIYGLCDWAEIKNNSDRDIELSNYCLTDSLDTPDKWRFPQTVLEPGQCIVVYCSSDHTDVGCTGFSLSRESEALFLTSGGSLVDCVPINMAMHGHSVGRLQGENGLFIFDDPSPGIDNFNGVRRVSAPVEPMTAPGVYNDTEKVSVSFDFDPNNGTLYYTTDGSAPDKSASEYTKPIELTETTVIRTIYCENGCLPSPAVTSNYIINENHTLPVVCVSTDLPGAFSDMYHSMDKESVVSGNISFFEDSGSFSLDCDVSLAGMVGSLNKPKKGLKIHFGSKYGESKLEYDLFGCGITEFSSLTVRAGGQDAMGTIYRSVLWESLGADMSDKLIIENSRYCILYVNGEYYGIYDLREDFSKSFYASHTGASKDSIEQIQTPVRDEGPGSFCEDIYAYILDNDISTEEAYRYLDERINMDAFIDLFIMQGVSANRDTYYNIRMMRSPELDNGRWQFALFDLDATVEGAWPFCACFGEAEYDAYQFSNLAMRLCRNPIFRDKLLTRYGEVYDTCLSNEAMLGRMYDIEAQLMPEIERNAMRWGTYPEQWYELCDHMHRIIEESDWQKLCVDELCRRLDIGRDEAQRYFGQ